MPFPENESWFLGRPALSYGCCADPSLQIFHPEFRFIISEYNESLLLICNNANISLLFFPGGIIFPAEHNQINGMGFHIPLQSLKLQVRQSSNHFCHDFYTLVLWYEASSLLPIIKSLSLLYTGSEIKNYYNRVRNEHSIFFIWYVHSWNI
jgi:hypothetical protein